MSDPLDYVGSWIYVDYDEGCSKDFENFRTYREILNSKDYKNITNIEFSWRIITPEMVLPPKLSSLYYDRFPSLYDGGKRYLDDVDDVGELPELPEGLKILNLSHFKFKKIPKLPSTLESLVIINCNDVLDISDMVLPEGLLNLTITDYKMNKLPELPLSLTHLVCSGCNLNKLPPILPPYLKILHCNNNNIKKIPPLPPSIESLYIFGNPLKILPASIANLGIIRTVNNKYDAYDQLAMRPLSNSNSNNMDLADFVFGYCKSDVKKYGKYKWATDIISNWFLKVKYDPNYKYCKRRLVKEYDETFT